MAFKDVKAYYVNVLQQYVDSKADLADFEQAVRDGNITEERLEEVKAELELVKENVDRLAYIIYLYNMPQKPKKKKRYVQENKDIIAKFKKAECDAESVYTENSSLQELIKQQLFEITNPDNN